LLVGVRLADLAARLGIRLNSVVSHLGGAVAPCEGVWAPDR
jgi:hypothetical protein